MRFNVLGALEVVGDSGEVVRLAPRQRLLLATLLSQPGHLVASLTLEEAVWGSVRRSSSSTLRWYVHGLRKALGSDRVRRAGDGILLIAEREEVDAERFESLARKGSAVEDPVEASALLAGALSLWHGPAYDGIDEPTVVRAEAERLDNLRWTALEGRLDADLTLGEHRSVIPELISLVTDQPFRERFRAQLMLALHRSGRTAEALQTYRSGRDLLVRELGIEPGEELRRLETAILQGDPDLARSNPTALHGMSGTRPVPAQLPPDLAAFVGREGWVTRLAGVLTAENGSRMVALSGPGGTGKSTAAIRIAYQVRAEFGDGQLYANLQGATPGATPLEPVELLSRFLRALDSDVPGSFDEATVRFRTLVGDRRILLVLDDARDIAQVRPLLPGGSECAVLITSRAMLSGLTDATQERLVPLSDVEAGRLLERLIGRERVEDDPAAIAAIARLCGNLPLALTIAAGRLAARPSWPLRKLADRLADRDRGLGELELDDRSVQASLDVSYDDLKPELAKGFALIGAADADDLTVPAVASLIGATVRESEDLLDALVDAQLMESPIAGRYAFHNVVRLYARNRAADLPEQERVEAIERLSAWYLAAGRVAARFYTGREGPRLQAGPDDPGQ